MSKPLVSDDLWAAIATLLLRQRSKPKGGRPRCDDRLALAGIIFVLRSGIPWEMLPREFGCSGMTYWRRLRDWQTAGVWTRLHRVLLECLSDAGQLDWSRASLDSAAVPAKRGVPRSAGTQRIAGQTGHEAPSCGRFPLGVRLSPANRPDSLMLAPTLDAVPGVRHGRGRPRKRSDKLHADKAYSFLAAIRLTSAKLRIRHRSSRPMRECLDDGGLCPCSHSSWR